MLFCISFRCAAWWFDNHILHKVFSLHFQYPPGPIDGYSSITDSIPSAGLYILVTILYLPICASQSLPPFHPARQPPPLWQPPGCSPYLRICFCFVHLLCSLNAMSNEGNHMQRTQSRLLQPWSELQYRVSPPASFLVSEVALAILEPECFLINVQLSLSTKKKTLSEFQEFAWNLEISLGVN